MESKNMSRINFPWTHMFFFFFSLLYAKAKFALETVKGLFFTSKDLVHEKESKRPNSIKARG